MIENKGSYIPSPSQVPTPPKMSEEDMTEDFKEWGDAWVYCNQHLRPHETGWCTVDVRDKVCIGNSDMTEEDAIKKCREWNFTLYRDKYSNE